MSCKSSCKKCQKVVAVSDQIVCRGFCRAAFHMICAKVDTPLLDQLGLYEGNAFWMCDDCAKNFANRTFPDDFNRPTYTESVVPDPMKSLQNDVTELKTALLALTAKIDKQPKPIPINTPRSVHGNIPRPARTPKHRRNGTPINESVTYANCGRELKTVDVTLQKVNIADDHNEDLFYLYLSAFDPFTAEDDVAHLVMEFLNTSDQPKVVKLVPRGKDLSSLNFVSFKVGIKADLKELALAYGTWPNDFTVRVFDSKTKNVVKLTGKTAPLKHLTGAPNLKSPVKSAPLKPLTEDSNQNTPTKSSGSERMETSSPTTSLQLVVE